MPLTIGSFTIDLDARNVDGPAGRVRLTPMEHRFLAHLISHRGRVVRTDELLREVWGYHPSIASKAVLLLVSRLRRKLGEAEGGHLIQTVGNGYMIEAGADDEALARRVDTLVSRLDHDPGALGALGAIAPTLEQRIEEDLPPTIAARFRIGLAAWWAHKQLHRPARPLWELVDRVPPRLGARAVLWAARLSLTAGSGAGLRDRLATWAERRPADPDELGTVAELQLMLARVEHGAAEYESARAHASTALELGTQLGDPALRGAAIAEMARLATTYCGGPGADASLALYQDAIAILSSGGVQVSAAVQRANAAVTLYLLGRAHEAIDQYERALPALTRSGRHLDAAFVRVNQGTARLACGDPDGAWAAATAASEEYGAAADFTGDAHARLLAGRAAAVLDRIDDAVAALGRAKELAERHGRTRVALHAKRYLGWCAHRRGDLDEARAHYAVELATGDSPGRAYLLLWRAWAAGEPDGAAFEHLQAELGHDPLEARAGPEFVDATLSRRLLEVGRARRTGVPSSQADAV